MRQSALIMFARNQWHLQLNTNVSNTNEIVFFSFLFFSLVFLYVLSIYSLKPVVVGSCVRALCTPHAIVLNVMAFKTNVHDQCAKADLHVCVSQRQPVAQHHFRFVMPI